MTAVTDVVSARVRYLMREFASSIKKDSLAAAWGAGRFDPVLNHRSSRGGGERKQLFDSYADGVDWTDEEQVQRACVVFENMLRELRPPEPEEWWEKMLGKLADELRRDGFEITPGLGIRRQGEHRPQDAREADDAYRDALRILRGALKTMSRLHRLTTGMVEDRLRDVLLVALNGYFEGRATAESINGDGKTDILLRIGDRNVLIVECKIWHGPADMPKALEQLLRYVDNGTTRAVLIFFMRTNNPEPLMAKAVAAVQAHPNYESTDPSLADVERQWSFIVRGNGSPGTALKAEIALLPVAVA